MRRVAIAALMVLAGCGAAAQRQADPSGSTLRSRWVDPRGNGQLQPGPGEPLRDRTELGRPRHAGREVARIVHLTDAHVRDEESPARASFLDRLGDPFTSTFRPHEALTTQILAAAVRSANAAHPDAIVEGGDLADNAQANELAWGIDTLRGGPVRPDSGAPGYDGIQEASDADSFYYRPDVDAPRMPSLLARAQQRFVSPGLRAPWYPVAGNHDVLVDGELAATGRTEAVATGNRRLVRPREGLSVPRSEARAPRAVAALLAHGLPGDTVATPADPRRHELRAGEALRRLRRGAGIGGGGGRLDYVFAAGRVRGVVLDLARRRAGSGGVVTAADLAFLRGALAKAGSRWVLVFSHQALPSAAGADRALALLDRDPHVVALVSGHTHANRITARRTAAGGYWLVSTASLADWPQQERVLRVRATAGGGAVLETWLLDTVPDPLADAARRLAYLDVQGGRPRGFAGTALDRDVRLWRDSPQGA